MPFALFKSLSLWPRNSAEVHSQPLFSTRFLRQWASETSVDQGMKPVATKGGAETFRGLGLSTIWRAMYYQTKFEHC
jgi:hypothetical protein